VKFNNYKIFVEYPPTKYGATKESFYNLIHQFHDMHILKLATSLPRDEYSTEKLMEVFPCQISESIRENVLNLGVKKRYLVNHATTESIMDEVDLVGLCVDACQKVIRKSGISIRDVGYFIAGYDVNPFLCPGLSQLLIRNIGFDSYVKHVNVQGVASTAFPKALELAEDFLATNEGDYVLICISGVSSYWFQNQVRGMKDIMEINQINSMKDRSKRQIELRKWVATMESFLFGDGVAAAVVAKEGEGLSIKRSAEVTNLGRKDYLAGYARLTTQNEPFKFGFYSHLGREIPELGAKYTSLVLKNLLGKKAEAAITAAEKWVVHTGSQKILNRIADTHGVPYERIRESHEILRDYGNLAGASLPFILERVMSKKRLSIGDVVLMVGYGWGFSAMATLLEYCK
jgi:3-oxoacyl-[acyl-carrier-protein] synthase III